MDTLHVEIWSDIACPWCYVGKRRLEAALARFSERAAVALRWRAFELDPSAPSVREPRPYAERLARKYSTSLAAAQAMIDRMTATGAAEGLELRFDRVRPGNTFDAHRLARFAEGRGRGDEAQERLFRAYLTEGEALGERGVLVRLAQELGLDGQEVRALLAGDDLAELVRADEREAARLGIHAVPHFRIGGRGTSGAQPAGVLAAELVAAWREGAVGARSSGGSCGPDGRA